MHPTTDRLVSTCAHALDRVRTGAPRVHCLTNAAAVVLTANALLALGATPSLSADPDEIGGFVASADALLVNLGTLDAQRLAAIDIAIEVAREDKTPLVLDPVFVDRAPARAVRARKLVAERPTIVKANQGEMAALMGETPTPSSLARWALGRVDTVAMTGAVDLVTDGGATRSIANGHVLATRVTAIGCAAGALLAAFAAVTDAPIVASVAGLLVAGIAGEIAAATAKGPGTFEPAFLDALAAIRPDDIMTRAKLT